ncbi:MAG: sigma 54-interacting transcriptional regulator [Fibrobacteres bacterium]|nr:sigma 54-interacting transcriptional regulator [Fibrobacterota bacterium]
MDNNTAKGGDKGYSSAEAAHKFNNILGSIRGYAEQLHKKNENNEEIARYTERILQACIKGVEFSTSLATNGCIEPPEKATPSENSSSQSTARRKPSDGIPRLLFVDDDEMIIEMFKEVMREIKIPCTFFSTGAEAIQHFILHNQEIDAVVVDMAMPNMNGKDVFNEIRKIAPGFPVIILSGYANSDEVNALTNAGAVHFKKPVAIEELLNKAYEITGLSRINSKDTQLDNNPIVNLNAQIAIVDDDPLFGELLLDVLTDHGLTAALFTDPRHFLKSVNNSAFSLALIDYKMPHINGMDLIDKIKSDHAKIDAILITGITGGNDLFTAAKNKGITCLSKPLDIPQFKEIIEGFFPSVTDTFSEQIHDDTTSSKMLIGTSVAMIRTRQLIERIARSEANLMIYGETGSGKELAARMIHSESNRSSETFIPVNCPSLPDNLLESELFGYEKGAFTGAHQTKKGLFEWANRGTIFLDEIGDLNYILQAKLLRAVQEQKIRRVGGQDEIPINVRIISATNKNLEEMISAGAFREDLYYRLNVVKIVMPNLRDRKEDIPQLVRHFMQKYNKRENEKKITDISLEVLNTLKKYDWPGNVRELENTLNEVFILAGASRITVKDLPQRLRQKHIEETPKEEKEAATIPIADYLENVKRDYLTTLLEKNSGNVSISSKEAGMNRAAFHRLLTSFKIDAETFRRSTI